MARKLLLVVPLLAVAALAAWAALRASRPPEWTTDSPLALTAFEQGLEAERKFYLAEALSHFERALELDPGFVAAQVALLRATQMVPRDEEVVALRKAMVEKIATADRSRLGAREAFLVDYNLALAERRHEDAQHYLDAYLAEEPDDPYALEVACERLWGEQRFAEAERIYERLLAVQPNWVRAQNNLGYLAMAQGRFADAEDRFLTYRYVAPDQANPHDSLGELLLLTGRWEEARRELEEALAVRKDFCASYVHLVYHAILTGQAATAPAILARAAEEGGCGPEWTDVPRCRVELWQAAQAGEWDDLVSLESTCAGKTRVWPWMPHLASLRRGDVATARAIEVEVARWVPADRISPVDRAVLAHLEGMRLVAEGRPGEGAARLAAADRELTYFGIQPGLFKLYNRLQWSDALARAGDATRAEDVLREVAAVNRDVAASFRSGELSRLRLPSPGAARPASAVAME